MIQTPSAPYLIFGFFQRSKPPLDLTGELLRLLDGRPLSGIARRRRDNAILEKVFDERDQALTWLKSVAVDDYDEAELTVEAGPGVNAFELVGNWRAFPLHACTPVVSLSTSGVAFTGQTEGWPGLDGISAYDRFLQLSRKLKPTYGAITVEWELESPSELLLDSNSSEGFQDLYLGEDLGSEVLEEAKAIFEGAYIHPMENGIYISSGRWFNPERISLNDGERRSRQIGAILADYFRRS